ncbi:hypothetical protein BCR41DRAFT_385755 [Lobosporangium transversale]|uniref:DUF2470 domain-containing protein n=1 Tax=Lobosporangium transversale TaxID=64571 RepID=A0A1Y2GRW6_9FUNG|nr:hypothetical protein BCR41DRAFT_385755 [Lobosporangium transversale]ORZ19110.1 hypothetical protein BCR41DRAFT_385755 [Lobosporangium transversale]|eukprot:XP_021882278.1 hypothetical protein BCR41DRAFT_385755 [Lobosporangium transversale]
MPRRAQDPIAEHSDSLCEYMNGHPTTVLAYARYFGEYPTATKATMTSIDQDGFDIICEDSGEEREVRVTFGQSMFAVGQVKHTLTTLAKEAEIALRGRDSSNQGLMPDSPSATLPEGNLLSTLLLIGGLTAFYLEFYPNTTNSFLQWILKTVGAAWIHRLVLLITGLHCFESLVSLYFTVIVGNGFFSLLDIIQWFILISLFGYPCLFHLIALANRQRNKQSKQKTN